MMSVVHAILLFNKQHGKKNPFVFFFFLGRLYQNDESFAAEHATDSTEFEHKIIKHLCIISQNPTNYLNL